MKMKRSNKAIIAFLIPSSLAFIYFYPRFLISWLGKDNPWTSFLYQYTFGFIFFGLGILLILRTKAAVPGRGRDSLWLKILFAGFLFFFTLHAAWVAASLYLPTRQEALRKSNTALLLPANKIQNQITLQKKGAH